MKGCLDGLGKLFFYVVATIVGAMLIILIVSKLIE